MPFPYAPEQYHTQLNEKQQRIQHLLSDWHLPDIEVFASKPSHYRMRAEFRFWHDGDRGFYAMFHPDDRKTPIEVTHFPVATERTNELMQQVLEAVNGEAHLKTKLFQVEFLTTQTGDALITLIYHRKLDEEWEKSALRLQEQLDASIIGRSRKQRVALNRDYVVETLNIAGRTYTFNQYENSFTQPNAGVCEQMVTWAVENTRHNKNDDLLELYCGNGNFSIPLAQNFRNALATEISRTSVHSAQENIAANQTNNLIIARMASEDLSNAWLNGVQSRRFNEFNIDQYNFDTVFVDPPRAGLDENTIELLKRFRRIVYVSCNPESMVENMRAWQSEYKITAAALFDQFPYTHHMEAGIVLVRI